MRGIVLMLTFLLVLPVRARAVTITAPTVPLSGAESMPERTDSFTDGLWELLQGALETLQPGLREAAKSSLSVVAAVLMAAVLQMTAPDRGRLVELAAVGAVAAMLLESTHSLIRLGMETVQELSQYGKLLLPVMTAALAAQGGVGTGTALYGGTAVFDAVLSSLIARILAPMLYFYLALATASGALGEQTLGKMRDLVKSFVSWCLKILLTVFTTYMSITGVVSGTTDAAALKAAKVTISSVVPVVGGILSDASEAVLVSAGLMKNSAGIYGILATLAVFLTPFLRIGTQYLMLKMTAAVCGIFGSKGVVDVIGDFSAAMGLLLAMTGSVCLMLLVSTVCFLKGVG